MKNLKTLLIISLLTTLTIEGQAQCAGKSEGTRAYNRVTRFVSHSFYQDKRDDTGATDESVNSIRVVENNKICSRIEQVLESDSEIDNSTLHDDLGKYFYETTNYYYAFWAFHPRFDGIPRTGPKLRFIVIKKDFSQNWKYYL